jgi:hypothetical protein
MRNKLASFALGMATWMLVAALGNLALRAGVPGYAEVESTMQFSIFMLCLRLAMGLTATVTAGMLAGYVSRSGSVGHRLGALFLVLFGANHVYLWAKFPVWFHLAFLCSLWPAAIVGSDIGMRMRKKITIR